MTPKYCMPRHGAEIWDKGTKQLWGFLLSFLFSKWVNWVNPKLTNSNETSGTPLTFTFTHPVHMGSKVDIDLSMFDPGVILFGLTCIPTCAMYTKISNSNPRLAMGKFSSPLFNMKVKERSWKWGKKTSGFLHFSRWRKNPIPVQQAFCLQRYCSWG